MKVGVKSDGTSRMDRESEELSPLSKIFSVCEFVKKRDECECVSLQFK